MVLWSKLFGGILLKNKSPSAFIFQNAKLSVGRPLKSGGDKHFVITPSRFTWHQFKDKINFYVLLGAIPCGLVVFYCNVFIGPAQLQPIPEGYVPKHWEYCEHPITRFISRYVWTNPQEDYEKQMHYIFEEDEMRKIRILEERIRKRMAEHHDYQAYYYRPATAKYIRMYKQFTDEYLDREGTREK